MEKNDFREFFNRTSSSREKWRKKNRFYHKLLEKYFTFIIPPEKKVIEIGCGTGDLLNALKPAYGLGIDFSPGIIEQARIKYPALHFSVTDAENLQVNETFDYVILSDLVGSLWDIQGALKNIHRICHPGTRVVISSYNFLWEPLMILGERLHIKLRQPRQNWLSVSDLNNLLYLEGFQVITCQKKILFPKYIPLLNGFINRFLANLPLINALGLINLVVARTASETERDYTVTIVIPARNEMGNIENAVSRIPYFGSSQEIIFVEGHSTDMTWEEIQRVSKMYPGKNIKIMQQSGKGKGNAVREGFAAASGEVLMILDADLTMPPEELPKYYQALKEGLGEFINGCRLVYPIEKQAMRALNFIANKFFGLFFSYLLGQHLKDTLCGTKVLFARDYLTIQQNRHYFGDFDPFGDFDLLFGAARLNLKITEIIVRYRERTYGSSQISRFRHGWLLVRMSLFAARKIKFI